MDRRTFLKVTGLGSIALAAGCTPEEHLYSLVQAPEDMVTGAPTWYASTCRECPAGCGVVAKNREGRIIKLEGNPLHPVNQGQLCMRGQAALQGIYHPDRLKTPLLREGKNWKPIGFGKAIEMLAARFAAAGSAGTAVMTETIGAPLYGLWEQALAAVDCPPPLVYEPLAYESLRAANKAVFGHDGLMAYRMEKADIIISFGADFLETWLSPVSYARQFKAMHAMQDHHKNAFVFVGPYQSLTGANADLWLDCEPGAEATIALGILHQVLSAGQTAALPADVRSALEKIAAPYTLEKVARTSGVDPERLGRVADRLIAASKPLILGSAAVNTGQNSLQTDLAANLLNLALDPSLSLLDFSTRPQVEMAAPRAAVLDFFKALPTGSEQLLLLNNTNPAFTLPPASGVSEALERESLFSVCLTNFMDETAQLADLVIPVKMPLETWDIYGGHQKLTAMLQPTMGAVTEAPHLGDLILKSAFGATPPAADYKSYLFNHLRANGAVDNRAQWAQALAAGGIYPSETTTPQPTLPDRLGNDVIDAFLALSRPKDNGLAFMATPSIRFFDGRGANRPWLCEIPDAITKVAWQTPVLIHPTTMAKRRLSQGDMVAIQSDAGRIEAPVYESLGVRPGLLAMGLGQGHRAFGRYANNTGADPNLLLPTAADARSGGPYYLAPTVTLTPLGRRMQLANTDGSRIAHERKIALSMPLDGEEHGAGHGGHAKEGLTMDTFPLTLPLEEGYDEKRDFYPASSHDGYRWAMTVDLDRCIGCGACATACYAENNIGIVGEQRILEGREMSWLRIERYLDPQHPERLTFFPLMCQQCDNAPCESVCPVYAPHHSKEGLNNQIYNRCIGTRFCVQNCPYKVRRFNWFDWDRPAPLPLQLNPDVTVRSKGVMEKCSFCIQRIKTAHNIAKNEQRTIADGEIVPACAQTCPTQALTFGNLMDRKSRVRQLADDDRAYQAMGYLNIKPAVIYLKKVVQEI